MLISQKQLDANRRNAARSTGPKTPEGRAAVRHNAAKHGLYARSRIIRSRRLIEDPVEYRLALALLQKTLKPSDSFEHFLVKSIADCLWRSRRAPRAETYVMSHRRQVSGIIAELIEKPVPVENGGLWIKLIRSLVAPECRLNVIRHRNRIRRRMLQAYSLLRLSQARRKPEATGEKEDYTKKRVETNPFLLPDNNLTFLTCLSKPLQLTKT